MPTAYSRHLSLLEIKELSEALENKQFGIYRPVETNRKKNVVRFEDHKFSFDELQELVIPEYLEEFSVEGMNYGSYDVKQTPYLERTLQDLASSFADTLMRNIDFTYSTGSELIDFDINNEDLHGRPAIVIYLRFRARPVGCMKQEELQHLMGIDPAFAIEREGENGCLFDISKSAEVFTSIARFLSQSDERKIERFLYTVNCFGLPEGANARDLALAERAKFKEFYNFKYYDLSYEERRLFASWDDIESSRLKGEEGGRDLGWLFPGRGRKKKDRMDLHVRYAKDEDLDGYCVHLDNPLNEVDYPKLDELYKKYEFEV